MIIIQWINTEEFGFISGLIVLYLALKIFRIVYLHFFGFKKMQKIAKSELPEFQSRNEEFQKYYEEYRQEVLSLRPEIYQLVINGGYTEVVDYCDEPVDVYKNKKYLYNFLIEYLHLNSTSSDINLSGEDSYDLQFNNIPDMDKIDKLYDKFKTMYSSYYELRWYTEVLLSKALNGILVAFKSKSRSQLKKKLGLEVLPEDKVLYKLNLEYRNSSNKVVYRDMFRFDDASLKALCEYARVLDLYYTK